jgi:hypothetical protein
VLLRVPGVAVATRTVSPCRATFPYSASRLAHYTAYMLGRFGIHALTGVVAAVSQLSDPSGELSDARSTRGPLVAARALPFVPVWVLPTDH